MQLTNTQDLSLEQAGGLTDVRECPKMSGHATNSPTELDVIQKRQLSVRLLVMGKSFASVARSACIDVRTLHRWRQEPEFRRAIQRLRQQLWSQAIDRLRTLVHPSLDELEKQLFTRNDRARYRSAHALLRLANVRKVAPVAKEVEDDEAEETD